MPMTTELIPLASMQQILRLDETIRESRRQVQEADVQQSPMLRGLLVARSMQLIRQQLSAEMMGDVMLLMGTPLGFTTDRDKPGKNVEKQPYTVEVVRDCLIECLLKGYRPVGGEMCIFSGRFYAAKPGNRRFVTEWPGLTNLRMQAGVPKTYEGGALVPYRASWTLNGVDDDLDCTEHDGQDMRIPVRVNEGMIVDAILGKAEAKMYARILSRLSGSPVESAEDVDDERIVEGTFTPSAEPPKGEQRILPGASPLDEAMAAFDALSDVGEVSRVHRNLVAEYPDYQDQIDGLAEAAKERISSQRGPRSRS
jgi:hypothetical protein